MSTSVIVPTYRRPDALTRCLDALARQDAAADEIIVVARRDDDESRRCIGESAGDSIRLVLIDVLPGQPGFVAALNAGVAASSGDIVCLTDDDAEPRPDWISRILDTFDQDPSIGAVGGRDWVYHGNHLDEGEEHVVGTVSWWGRRVGGHHHGVGSPRDVAVLKGVNFSARGDLIRQMGFDKRLLGTATEHHSELGFCLKVLQMGYRVVYDPAIAVDHRLKPRVVEEREFGPRQVRDGAHNETLALLEYLSPKGRAMHILWTVAVGSRAAPGFAQAALMALSHEDASRKMLRANLDGRRLGVASYLRYRGRSASRNGALGYPTANRMRLPKVLAIAHSAPAHTRAGQLLGRLFSSGLAKPSAGVRGMASSAWKAITSRADVIYLVDIGKTTAPAALLGRLTGKRIIVDTGDACFALARSLGDRSFMGLLIVGAIERLTLACAHKVVVRGQLHAEYVPGRVTHIPDIAPPNAGPVPASDLRHSLGLEGFYVVGVVGSLNLSKRRQTSYGWDLIEVLANTDPTVVGLIVGDGTGRETLRRRAQELDVLDRCRFVGQVSTDRVCEYVCAMDVALSTQTNDIVGRVRTTGKLPLYLASHRPVLTSHVGEAARVLGPLGWTIPYRGVVDHEYPLRLAEKIEEWRENPQGAEERRTIAARLSKEEFDPEIMRDRLERLIKAQLEIMVTRNN